MNNLEYRKREEKNEKTRKTLSEESNKIISELKKENEDLINKLTINLQDSIDELREKETEIENLKNQENKMKIYQKTKE